MQNCAVVVTGMGFVTPLGRERAASVAAMRLGNTGIEPVLLDGTLPVLMGRVPGELFPRHAGDMTIDFVHAAVADAWNEAGLTGKAFDPWRVATVIGSSKGRLANLLKPGKGGSSLRLDPTDFPGDTLGLEVAADMGFSGPTLNYPAACATGIVSIIRGIEALQYDEADIVLAGSGEASGHALLMASFKNMGALSEEMMRPFDRQRAGFNPGEGAAVFVLEREEDAMARGAQTLAKIVGWDQRSDAHHITSADPDGDTIAYSIRRVMERAGWTGADVEYINAHGTGTQLNDMVEGRAINLALPAGAGCGPLVSGIKPYIGHLLGASSAVELALAIACVRDGFIPPTPNLELPDMDIPLHFVPTGGVNTRVRRIMKLSLGFGGHIGVMALEIP